MRKKTWFQEKQPPVIIAEKSEIALPLERVPLPDRGKLLQRVPE
jgi:hypothetical protein